MAIKITFPLALLIISLTLTLSSATHNCPGFDSVPDLLSHYNLPPGLFPDAVENFECTPIETDKLKVTLHVHVYDGPCFFIRCHIPCRVTTSDFHAEYQKTISATIYENNLTNLKGVSVTVTDNKHQPLVPVTEVRAFFNVAFQFNTQLGYSPVYLFENLDKPRKCDPIPLVYGGPLLLGA